MNKTRQIFLHIIIWIAVLLFFLFVTSNGGKIKYSSVVIFIYFGALNIAIFYLNYLFILPAFLNTRRYHYLAASIVGLIIISGFIKYGLAWQFKEYILVRGMKKEYQVNFAEYYLGAALTSTFFVFLSTAFKFTIDWFINEKLRKNLENEKLTAELAFLKSQINPHFLLNSLNNIYSLAYQRAAKTPEAILKLSEIMRYMLYESNDMRVDLAKEIRYLENYIELQKIRFKDSAFIELQVNCDGSNNTIVPLILIPFIENAFKHGVVNDAQNPVKINITVHAGRLLFAVYNKKNIQNKDETGGIGFHNVKRRLDLLYPGKYTLDIQDEPLAYNCELSLDL